MRHINIPPRIYKNERLMKEFNQLLIEIKAQLFLDEQTKVKFHKPTVQEIDILMNRIMEELRKDYFERKF